MQIASKSVRLLLCSCSLGLAVSLLCQPRPAMHLAVNPSSPGTQIAPDFLGLSFETQAILSDAKEQYGMFRASNQPLVNLFRTLGVGSLRIGGNTADRPDIRIPEKRDIDELFAFAKQSHVKVIYTLRLRSWAPDKDVPIAKYLMDHYAAQLSCIAIGNEPDMYEQNDLSYAKDIAHYLDAITAAVPNVRFCGPGTTPPRGRWAAQFADRFARTMAIEWVTQHAYPASFTALQANSSEARLDLLSPKVMEQSERNYATFGPAVREAGLRYRIEETNSDYRMAGRAGVSDSFASALWGLDDLYWWAQHGAAGVNFHTGDTVAVKGGDGICIYAVFRTAQSGYDTHPLSYAMKAFALTGRGRLLTVSGDHNQDVAAYAVAEDDGNVCFTLIYKARHPRAKALHIMLDAGPGFTMQRTMLLTSPGADLASTHGITLGGSEIGANGQWDGHWDAVPNGSRSVSLVPDTALLVQFSPAARTGY